VSFQFDQERFCHDGPSELGSGPFPFLRTGGIPKKAADLPPAVVPRPERCFQFLNLRCFGVPAVSGGSALRRPNRGPALFHRQYYIFISTCCIYVYDTRCKSKNAPIRKERCLYTKRSADLPSHSEFGAAHRLPVCGVRLFTCSFRRPPLYALARFLTVQHTHRGIRGSFRP
jgi:hypothetical protein